MTKYCADCIPVIYNLLALSQSIITSLEMKVYTLLFSLHSLSNFWDYGSQHVELPDNFFSRPRHKILSLLLPPLRLPLWQILWRQFIPPLFFHLPIGREWHLRLQINTAVQDLVRSSTVLQEGVWRFGCDQQFSQRERFCQAERLSSLGWTASRW